MAAVGAAAGQTAGQADSACGISICVVRGAGQRAEAWVAGSPGLKHCSGKSRANSPCLAGWAARGTDRTDPLLPSAWPCCSKAVCRIFGEHYPSAGRRDALGELAMVSAAYGCLVGAQTARKPLCSELARPGGGFCSAAGRLRRFPQSDR